MSHILWTREALKDLNRGFDYIAADSKVYAWAWVESILNKVDVLEKFPKSGRMVPEIRKESIREVLVGDYRVIYDLKETVIRILTIIHGTRRLR